MNLHFDERDIAYLRDQGIFSDEFLDYLKDFSFTGDVYAFPEGSIIYPNEPVITIVAPPHRRTNRRNCSAYYDEPSILNCYKKLTVLFVLQMAEW